MKKIHVVAAVIKKEDKIFVTQRGYGEFKDKWEFPGGKIEKGEKKEDALLREIREELDASIAIDCFLSHISYTYPTFQLEMDVYLAHLLSPHLELLEHENALWLEAKKLKTLDWLEADKSLIDILEKKIKN